MKTNSNHDYFLGGSVAPKESRFEQAEIGRAPETDIFGHFGPKLQKVFPLPVATSESDGFHVLLREIQAKLSSLTYPEEG